MPTKYDVPVSFAFLTPPALHVCSLLPAVPLSNTADQVHSQPCNWPGDGCPPRSRGLSASRTAETGGEIQTADRFVAVKWLDHRQLSADTRVFSSSDTDTISTIYKQLRREGIAHVESVVCFTTASAPGLRGDEEAHSAATYRVLHDHERVPSFFFCQAICVPRFVSHLSFFVCTHFLVFSASGEVRQAQIPCFVPTTNTLSVDVFFASLALQLGATPAEAEYLRLCPLFLCNNREGVVTIQTPVRSNYRIDENAHNGTVCHVALLLPLLAPGDVVRVDVRSRGAVVTVQGIVARTCVISSQVQYDIREGDSSLEFASQACTRVVPL